MNEHGKGIDGYGKFHRVNTICSGFGNILVLHLTRGVGEVYRPIDE